MPSVFVFDDRMPLYKTSIRERDDLMWTQTTSVGLAFNSGRGSLDEYGFLRLEFDWSRLENVTGLKGTLSFPTFEHGRQFEVKVPIKLDESNRSCTKRVLPIGHHRQVIFGFELKACNQHFDRFEKKAEFSDAILNVNGKSIHVNKTILSMNSDFFRVLFTPKSEDKKTKHFTIDDINYNVLIILMKLINQFIVPSIDQFPAVLSLIDRFSMEGPKRLLEDRLMVMEDVKLETKLELAEQFHLGRLRDFCVGQISCLYEVQTISCHAVFGTLSSSTKAMILDRIVPSTI